MYGGTGGHVSPASFIGRSRCGSRIGQAENDGRKELIKYFAARVKPQNQMEEEQEICRKMHRKNGDSLKTYCIRDVDVENRYGKRLAKFLFQKGNRKFTVWIRESMTVESWWIVIL